MSNPTLNRRDVVRLGLAALGGLLSGIVAGCGGQGKTQKGTEQGGGAEEKASLLLNDPHVCRGINTCKNKGKPGTTNECAGQAQCATVAAHDCNGMNDCKGQGGRGEHPAQNTCHGKPGSAVPLSQKPS